MDAADGSEPVPVPAPAPEGSVQVHMRRLTTFPGNVKQVLAMLGFTSYFFFWPIGVLIWLGLSPWALSLCSWRALWSFSGIYTLQLIFWRPHLKRGLPYHWFLYGSLVDYALRYSDATCIREGPAPDPKRPYIFAMYPHGVYAVNRAFSGGIKMWRTLFPGVFVRWGSFSAAFYLPGIREFSWICGCTDAGKPHLEGAIRRGESVALLPGGIDEMNLTDGNSKETKIVVLDRKGFVKLAIENGIDIVPGFCFGEKYVHTTVQLPALVRRLLRPLRLSGTMLKGRGLSFLPYQKPLGFVWATPIQVKQQKPVEEAYLDEVHADVMKALRRIFDTYKARFGYDEEEKLVMVSASEAKVSLKAGSSDKKRA